VKRDLRRNQSKVRARAKPEKQTELLYGRQPVREMLRAGRRQCFEVVIAGGARGSRELDEIRSLAGAAGVDIRPGDPRDFSAAGGGSHHQGVLALVSPYPYADLDGIRERLARTGVPPLVVLLDHVQDPQNLGSIMRTAEAAGADAVIIPSDRAACVTPAAVRASSGAAEHIRVARVTNLVRTMKALQKDGLWLSGLEDVSDAKPFTEADLSGPVGLVIGAEGAGLGRLVRETCDFLVSLPMYGNVSSLNAGVAAGIILYECVRQRVSADG